MDNIVLENLVSQAHSGCRESLALLSEHFQDELYLYLYRLTLNQSAAEDIRQETLLQMCKSIGDLESAKKFKAWLFKIAWAKAMNHFRTARKHQHMTRYDDNLVNAIENNRFEGLQNLISKDIAETLLKSISQLDPKQRSVLVLRCYESLSYSEIASIMNCTETTSRVLFYRAKINLKKRLNRKGITAPMFLGLLGLFGQVTSNAEAAVTVSASTLKVGGLSALIGWMLSKTSIVLLSLVTSGAIIAGTLTISSPAKQYLNPTSENDVKSFHFTKHAWQDAYIPTANLRLGRSLSKGAYEQWFFFPDGEEGPMFKMMQRWDPEMTVKLCSWLLNEEAQHYYHSGENRIYLMDNPLARRKTARFPTDSQEFCDFLDKMEGKEAGLEYKRDPKTGYLIEMIDHRFANAKDFVSGVERNTFDETEFGNFRYKWPHDAELVDQRSTIHQQGWTLYAITGNINGTSVRGSCRIPFVYEKLEDYPPLLLLHIGDHYSIVDSPDGAFIINDNYKVIASYPPGSFFKGLIRPWYGLHTIDLLRRQAAKQKIPFELENLEYDGYSYQRRILRLHKATGHDNLKVIFDVDIENNEIQQIKFTQNDGHLLGSLEFRYPRDPSAILEAIEIPAIKKTWFSTKEPLGILWLFELAQGTLDQK